MDFKRMWKRRAHLAAGALLAVLAAPHGLAGEAPDAEGVVDLAVRLEDTPDPVVVDRELRYLVTIRNRGDLNATNVSLELTLHENATVVSAKASQGGCLSRTGVVTCELGVIEPAPVNVAGGRPPEPETGAVVDVRITLPDDGDVPAEARVYGAEPDADPGNDVAKVKTRVIRIGKDRAEHDGEKGGVPFPGAPLLLGGLAAAAGLAGGRNRRATPRAGGGVIRARRGAPGSRRRSP